MEQSDTVRIAAGIRQLQVLWLAFLASAPFSALVVLAAIPSRSPAEGLLFGALGLLTALPALMMAPRFRHELDAWNNGRSADIGALQRALVFGATAAETPMLVGVVQYALQANPAILLLLSAVSFATTLLFRPRGR
jgi:hypothetical protein